MCPKRRRAGGCVRTSEAILEWGGTSFLAFSSRAIFSFSLPRPLHPHQVHISVQLSGGRKLDVDPCTPYTQDWKQIREKKATRVEGGGQDTDEDQAKGKRRGQGGAPGQGEAEEGKQRRRPRRPAGQREPASLPMPRRGGVGALHPGSVGRVRVSGLPSAYQLPTWTHTHVPALRPWGSLLARTVGTSAFVYSGTVTDPRDPSIPEAAKRCELLFLLTSVTPTPWLTDTLRPGWVSVVCTHLGTAKAAKGIQQSLATSQHPTMATAPRIPTPVRSATARSPDNVPAQPRPADHPVGPAPATAGQPPSHGRPAWPTSPLSHACDSTHPVPVAKAQAASTIRRVADGPGERASP